MKKEEKKEKATEGKEVDMKKKLDEADKEIRIQRAKSRDECLQKIETILEEHGCILTARVIVGETGNIPQVFLMDMPNDVRG